jgi:3-dehydroquinate dehydratase-2
LHDAIKGVQLPVIELHISNIHRREPFRHHSYVSAAAAGVIVGLGSAGYEWAIRALVAKEGRDR